METAAAPLIEADGVGKRYGSVTALDDVSLSVDARAIGLLGANGAGKSTLMKLMLGLVRPDSGRIRVLGSDAAAQSWDARRRFGYMPEHDCLPMGMTARDLVVHMGELRGLPRRVAVLRASEVLFQVGLEEERSRLIRTFSVGMRQRTNLAQAIVHSPELVVLDEPTNGLDPAGREEMLQLVRRLSVDLGIAVVMSSHVLEDVARTCDTVVVLREGTVAAVQAVVRPDEHEARELRVRVSGDGPAFIGELERRGVHVRTSEDDLVVSGPAREELLDAVRDAAVAAGVGLRQLTSAGPTLEDALIGAMS
ncbi:MAG TPA: ABC transporter ATP-binding protein [Gaiellales bacterium]|nr:ABC transporter ATP-binding protein [Gaiellales bacterium]